MDLHEAFKTFAKKYYDGFEYAETNKVSGGGFKYGFKDLDAMHKEIVPKRKPKDESKEHESMETPEEETVEPDEEDEEY